MNHLKTTLTKLKSFDVMFYAFGVAIILNSLSTAVVLHKLFGGSTTPNREPITHLLTPPSVEIK
jgi:hypothetical protein